MAREDLEATVREDKDHQEMTTDLKERLLETERTETPLRMASTEEKEEADTEEEVTEETVRTEPPMEKEEVAGEAPEMARTVREEAATEEEVKEEILLIWSQTELA